MYIRDFIGADTSEHDAAPTWRRETFVDNAYPFWVAAMLKSYHYAATLRSSGPRWFTSCASVRPGESPRSDTKRLDVQDPCSILHDPRYRVQVDASEPARW